MVMHLGELRIVNVRLACTACRATIVIPGPWNGPVMAAWRAMHLRTVTYGWTVLVNQVPAEPVVNAIPPAVHRR